MLKNVLKSCAAPRSILAFLFIGLALVLPHLGYAFSTDHLVTGSALVFGIGEIELADIKDLVVKQGTAWEEFKKVNDQRLEALEKKGFVPADLDEKLAKINDAISQTQIDFNELQKNANRLQDFESKGQNSAEKLEYKAAVRQYLRSGDDANLKALQTKAYNGASNPDGGYFVEEEMDSEIIRVVSTVSAIGRLARNVTIGTKSFSKIVKTSGMAARRVGDGATGGETANPKWAELEFVAHVAEAEPQVFNELLEDSFYDLEGDLSNEAVIAFAELAGYEFANGSGVGQARGITQYDTVANANYTWGKLGYVKTGVSGAFAATNPGDDMIALQHSLKAQYRPGAAFVMADSTLATVRQFKDGSGNFYLWNPDPTAGFGGRLLGSPVEVDDNMPVLAANAFAIAYGNFQQGYIVINRTGTSVIRDNVTTKGRTKFNFRRRFGGGVQNFEAIKLMKFGTT